MDKRLCFIIIGGDCRFSYMDRILKKDGYNVRRFFPGPLAAMEIQEGDVLILPVPVSRDGKNINTPLSNEALSIQDFLKSVPENALVAGGLFSPELKSELENRNAKVFDYYKSEDVALKNAVPTAEGVIGILISSLPVTINGLRTIVTGYGRCARAISTRLKALGAEVTAVARSDKNISAAAEDGMNVCYLSDFLSIVKDADAVINTIPSEIIGKEILNEVKKDCLIIETASSPYGVDFDAASEKEITVIKAGSLPGRTAPLTAGKIICGAVLRFAKENVPWAFQ